MKWGSELELAERAASTAARYLHDRFAKDKHVLSEVGRDIKLQADQDAEALVLEVLAGSDYPVLAEESGATGTLEDDAPVWIVDPLDGTLNYKHGIPLCCVSVALSVGGAPVVGVIDDFNRGEVFRGVVGEGAWLNDEPMRVSDIEDPSRAILATGFPTKLQLDEAVLRDFVATAQRFKKVRMLGSAALMMAYVACGRVDAYAEDDIMYWDVAAGAALVEAAGGWVTMAPSGADRWARRIRCASTAALWPES